MSVIDLPEKLAIEVSVDDIQSGRPSSNCACAVALALKRVAGIARYSVWVEFGTASATFTADGEACDVYLHFPPEVSEFIQAFDNGDQVKPFTFHATVEAS